MSIERDLSRIADALEAMVLAGKTQVQTVTCVQPEVKVAPPVTTGKGLAAVPAPVAPVAPVAVAPTTSPNAWPASPEELRLMAQKIAQKLGPKTLEFTAWVMAELKGLGVATMMDVPGNKIIELAVKLDAYAKERGINV